MVLWDPHLGLTVRNGAMSNFEELFSKNAQLVFGVVMLDLVGDSVHWSISNHLLMKLNSVPNAASLSSN